MHSILRRLGIICLVALAGAAVASGQTRYPKPPDQYAVQFRYRIKADRNERIRQFEAMQKFLGELGFKENESADSDLAIFDPAAERMTGSIPSSSARSLLRDPRIQTVLLMPGGYKPPQDEKERVRVMLDLSAGFPPERQKLFSQQVARVLEAVGFQEGIAYDHRGYTRLRGTLPWIKISTLLKDLRTQPSGWFLPVTHEEELPEPYRSALPIRVIEVLPDDGAPAAVPAQQALPPIPPDQPQASKLTAELRRYLLQEGKKDEKVRVEAILVEAPSADDPSWREFLLQANPSTVIEGKLGNVVTVSLPAGEQAAALARAANIVAIRLPRAANVSLPPGPKEDSKKEEPKKDEPKKEDLKDKLGARSLTNVAFADSPAVAPLDVLKETRLDRLHARGMRGTGYRVAIFDTDFAGFEKFLGKELAKSTRLVDLTAERNSDILPEPSAAAGDGIGHGTHCALAVRFAAPGAELVLIRIAADAPYQVATAYRYILGDFRQPESFRIRRDEIEADAGRIRNERVQANELYRKAFDDFSDDEAGRQRRREARAAIAAVEQKELALTARTNRLLNLELALAGLKGTKVVLNTVGWNTGMPLDGRSALSRFLDDKMLLARTNPVRNSAKLPVPTLWFQPAGDTRGQSWSGLFRDSDDNGVMEFVPPGTLLPADRWTPELNFLAFRNDGKEDSPELPMNARVRITIQWREAHDPELSELEYREPIAPLKLLLLRQRDPGAEKLATDELEPIARSEGTAERLSIERNAGVYELSMEVAIPADGRYALRVEGRLPSGLRPGGSLGIRDQEIHWELRPRIFIEVLDAATRAKGRIVFTDFESQLGGVAIPADARSVVAVGAMQANYRPQPYSAIGAGPQQEMFIKPDVMTFDQLPKLGDGSGPARGSSLSAALATGMGTSLLSGGARPSFFMEYLKIPPGHIFQVPERWAGPVRRP